MFLFDDDAIEFRCHENKLYKGVTQPWCHEIRCR